MPQRFLRPGLISSKRWDGVSWQAQSFYVRLLTLVDDFGRYEADPMLLRSHAFPLRDDIRASRVTELCDEIAKAGLVKLYHVEPKDYLQIEKWEERARSPKSKYPDPPQDSAGFRSGTLPPKPSPLAISHKPSPAPDCASADVADVMRVLVVEICAEYGRKSARLSYLEESTLLEICRTESALEEWIELKAYKAALPGERKRFFPSSVESLLLNWQKTLDTSRNRTDQKPVKETGVPTSKEVHDYAKEKWGSEPKWSHWAASFFGHWSNPKVNWRKGGKLIDWQVELGNQVGKWRAEAT